jgi:hypothetical protein
MPVWPKAHLTEKWSIFFQKWIEQNIDITLLSMTHKFHSIVSFTEINGNTIYIVEINPITITSRRYQKEIFLGQIIMAFSELSRKIVSFAVKMTHDSVWVETDLIIAI